MIRDWPGLVSPSHALHVRGILRRRFPALSWDEREDLAIDFDLGVWEELRWADQRGKETVEEEAPRRRHRRDTVTVPKYRTVDDLLALGEDDEGTASDRMTMAPDEVAEKARTLLRGDPEALRRFLEGDGITAE